jgi:nucleoside diphosphate kinase
MWREREAEEASCYSAPRFSAVRLTKLRTNAQFYAEHKGADRPRRFISAPVTNLSAHRSLLLPTPGTRYGAREPESAAQRLTTRKTTMTSQVQHAVSGPLVALALCSPDGIQRWRNLIGPTRVFEGQWERPESLRARYGLSDTRNGFHGVQICVA